MLGRSATFFVAIVVSLAASVACSDQGEGEYCSMDNGVTGGDCQNGLECVAAPGVGAGVADPHRCCPVDLSQATTAVCMASTVQLDASNEIGDAFPQAASAGDAGDASREAMSAALDASSSDGSTDQSATSVSDATVDASDAVAE
jgi:hypothetical protein